MPEYWGFGKSEPTRFAATASSDEVDGWDGLVFTDSQNLRPDVYVVMATVAAVTSRLKVSAGVTNPVTRHPAVSASAIAALHIESGGRASFGIGRGDSALAYIGQAPCSMALFERYVRHVQTMLSGGRVPFAELQAYGRDTGGGRDIDILELADQPTESWLRWLEPSLVARFGKVPVEVIATGPKAIAVGGRHADIVTFTVGADLDRLSWGIETARAAAREAGRDPQALRFGAYLNVACHPNIATARTLVSGGLASFSRFSAMHGTSSGPLSKAAEEIVRNIRDSYDMKHHGEPDSSQTAVLTDDFVDRFAVVGDPGQFTARIEEIVALGFERIVMTTPNQATRERYTDETATAHRLLVEKVLPALPR